jgi:hypothetical protein
MVAGGTYLLTYVMKPDGSVDFYVNGSFINNAAIVALNAGSGAFEIGVNASASWLSGNGKLYRAEIYSKALSAAEVKNLFDASGIRSIAYQSGWGSPVSTAVRGGVANSQLETTGWRFGDTVGRWQITTSTIQGKPVKALLQTTSSAIGPEYGILKKVHNDAFSPQEHAYGTWEWSFYCATRASYRDVYFNSTLTGYTGTKYDAAMVSPTNGIVLFVYNIARFSSASDYLVNGNWYRFRVTRSPDSVYTIWIRGGTYTNWKSRAPLPRISGHWVPPMAIMPSFGSRSFSHGYRPRRRGPHLPRLPRRSIQHPEDPGVT